MSERDNDEQGIDERTIDFRYAPDTSWTLICRPDDPHKTLVDQDGTLLYGFEQTHLGAFSFRRTIEFSAQTGKRPTGQWQRTESASVPIVETTIEYPNCRLQLTTAAHQTADGRRYDVVLWSVRVHEHVPVLLTGLHMDINERDRRHAGAGPAPDHRVYAIEPDRVPEYPLFPQDDGGPAAEPTRAPLLTSVPQRLERTHPTGFRPASGFRTEPMVLRAGETVRGALIVGLVDEPGPETGEAGADSAADHTDHSTTRDLAWAENAVQTERAYWQGRTDLRLPIQVPDPCLQDMLVAAARNLLQAREPDGEGVPVFQVGPTVYRGLWVVDGHFLLEAARYLHLIGQSRQDTVQAVRPLLGKVRPDGSINALAEVADPTRHPHTKETAIGIATLVRQWELSGDDDWLTEVWPVIRNAVGHIARLREAADALPEDSGSQGLMPPAFADGGAAGIRPELTTALWTVAGLRHGARAARALAAEDREQIENMAERLRADFDRVAERDAGTLPDGRRYLPMVLPGSGSHHTLVDVDNPPPEYELRPQTATWALAQAIWPGEVFGPDEPVVADFLHLLDLIDDEEGIPVETGWLPYRAMWTYYASFAAHVWLYADYPEKAVSLLYAMCNHAAPTRVWREEQSLASSGDGRVWGDMPHNWASAELIRLVRHLVVFEVGSQLRLLPGVPDEWLLAGGLTIRRTPTRFGPVDVAVDDRHIRVEFAEESRLPERCLLRIPDGEWRLELRIAGGLAVERRLSGPGWVELTLP